MKLNSLIAIFASLVLTLISFRVSAQNAGIGDLVDLDSSIGFSNPRLATILNSVDRSKNTFYIFPAAVDFILPQDGASSIGMQVAMNSNRRGAFTFTVRPKFDTPDIVKAVEELKARYPKALFAYPTPSKVKLSLSTIEQSMINFSPSEEISPLSNKISFTANLTPIETRFLLLPQSLDSPSATFQFVYNIRGGSRDADGKINIVDRSFRLGGVLNGFCAPFPQTTVMIASGKVGCSLVVFNKRLVMDIQKSLFSLKFYFGGVDGIFGSLTEEGIRKFQKKYGLFVTGYPTTELRDKIAEKSQP